MVLKFLTSLGLVGKTVKEKNKEFHDIRTFEKYRPLNTRPRF